MEETSDECIALLLAIYQLLSNEKREHMDRRISEILDQDQEPGGRP